jgi:hypothetical protein
MVPFPEMEIAGSLSPSGTVNGVFVKLKLPGVFAALAGITIKEMRSTNIINWLPIILFDIWKTSRKCVELGIFILIDVT